MNRIIAALIASVAFLAFAAPSSAQTGTMAAPAKPAAMATKAPSMKMSSMKTTAAPKCAAGTTMVKGYTKANGTVVKPYCRKSS
jgi:hypothetical protein